MDNEDIKRFFKDNEPMKPQKMTKDFLTSQAAREIWECCKQYAIRHNNQWGTPSCCVEDLTESLQQIQLLIEGSSDKPLGFFLTESGCQHLQQGQKVQRVTSGQFSEVQCKEVALNAAKEFFGADVPTSVVNALVDAIVRQFRVKSIAEGETKSAALDARNDELDSLLVFKGDRIVLIL